MILRRFVWPLAGAAAVVGLAAGVFPTRTYLEQRDQIAAEEAKIRVLSDENQRLAARVRELHTDEEIERLAREQYNLVLPGEEAYAILPGPADPDVGPVPTEPSVERPSGLLSKALDAITFWD